VLEYKTLERRVLFACRMPYRAHVDRKFAGSEVVSHGTKDDEYSRLAHWL
jgi:hypothetical protein